MGFHDFKALDAAFAIVNFPKFSQNRFFPRTFIEQNKQSVVGLVV